MPIKLPILTEGAEMLSSVLRESDARYSATSICNRLAVDSRDLGLKLQADFTAIAEQELYDKIVAIGSQLDKFSPPELRKLTLPAVNYSTRDIMLMMNEVCLVADMVGKVQCYMNAGAVTGTLQSALASATYLFRPDESETNNDWKLDLCNPKYKTNIADGHWLDRTSLQQVYTTYSANKLILLTAKDRIMQFIPMQLNDMRGRIPKDDSPNTLVFRIQNVEQQLQIINQAATYMQQLYVEFSQNLILLETFVAEHK